MERSAFNDNYPIAQFGLTIIVAFCVAIILTMISMAMALPIFGLTMKDMATPEILNLPQNINAMKYLQIFQSIGLFVLPAFLLGKFFSGNSIHYLKLDNFPKVNRWLLACLLMLTAIPAIDFLAELNSRIRLPEFLSGLQNYIESTSKLYQDASEAFMKVTSLKGLAVNLLIIAVIPAFGEELLFRGILQRIFINWTRNIHWGIIISAFLFSAFHMEFYAFFPRWLLGIMFGYMLVWTGSIWTPIFAHFLNNAIAVILYYLVHVKVLNESATEFGTKPEFYLYTIILTIISGICVYLLYRKRVNVNS
jgi:membrane protease YdiL (CAAX protease family)